MSNDQNVKNDDDLWAKCQQDVSISAQDLNLTNTANSNGLETLTENTNYLQFELNNQNNNRSILEAEDKKIPHKCRNWFFLSFG